MKTKYFFLAFFSMLTLPLCSQTQIGQTIPNFAAGDGFGTSVSMSDNGSRLLTSAFGFDTDGVISSGRVDVYEFDGSDWVQLGQTLDGGTSIEFGHFGRGLDMSASGNRIAIGNLFSKSQVYEWNDGGQQWDQMGSDLEFPGSPGSQLRRFRFTADENTLVIGGSNAGNRSVYVFKWDGNNWNAIGSPLTTPARDEIAISDDAQTIANLYRESNGNSGIKIYTLNGNNWTLEFTRDVNYPREVSDGMDISANGDRLVLSIWDENSETGTFETYDLVGGSWQASVSTFSLPSESRNNSLRLSDYGKTFIYGSGTENAAGGGARIYSESDNDWNLVNYFDYPNYDESMTGNVFINGNGTKVAFGQGIPFGVGFVKVYDLSDVLAIESPSTKALKLYPNPTTGTLHIDMTSSREIQKATVFDVMGRIVQQINFDSTIQNSIHLEGPSGIYFINLVTNDSQKTYKVMKH